MQAVTAPRNAEPYGMLSAGRVQMMRNPLDYAPPTKDSGIPRRPIALIVLAIIVAAYIGLNVWAYLFAFD
jgi:hypothetical protein